MCSVVDAWWFVTYLREAIVRWVVTAEAQHRVRRAEPPVPDASYQATNPTHAHRWEWYPT
jgi:hypothetical protein